MAVKLRVTSPVYCGKCGKRRGLVHACVVRRARGKTRIKAPAVTLGTCPRCGGSVSNPFAHVCQGKPGDFKRRKAAHERAQRKRKAEQLKAARQREAARRRAQGGAQPRGGHRPETCRDEDCARMPCRMYREGYDNGEAAGQEIGFDRGFDEGRREGHKVGHKEGYRKGFADALRKAAG